MYALIYLRRQYNSPLPPPALLRRLEHTVLPRPAGLFWWLGVRRLPCWGKVQPITASFWARMPWGRSGGPVIRGYWQAAHPAILSFAGTTVQLTIRPPLLELLGGSFMLIFLVLVSLATLSLVVAGIAGVLGLFFITDTRWGIRRAERYFQEALGLTHLLDKPI